MTDKPWWYSGDDAPSGEPTSDDADSTRPSFDVASLAAGAQRLIDWAGDKIMAPHAGHADAREHPQCVVCRTMLLLGEGGQTEEAQAERDDASADASSSGVTWIPIRSDRL